MVMTHGSQTPSALVLSNPLLTPKYRKIGKKIAVAMPIIERP